MTPWLWFSIRPVIASASGTSFGLAYNTVVVVTGVAAVGFAAGVVGSLALLRKRPLVGDAAAHATLAGVALAFLATLAFRTALLLLRAAQFALPPRPP